MQFEYAAALTAQIKAVENLSHAHRKKRHGDTICTLRNLPDAGFDAVPDEVCSHRHKRDEEALIGNIKPESPGKNPVLCTARLAAHQIGFALFHAECKSREAVGNQVDPKQVHRLQNHEAEKRSQEHAEHLAHIGAEQELDGLADVIINAAAFANRANNGGEIIICKHHVSNVFRYIRSSDSHADTDICAFDAGCIVHAIAGHGCDAAMLTPSINNAYFVFRLHAGIYAVMVDRAAEFLVADVIELSSGNGLAFVREYTELLCDCNRSVTVVAGNHHRADARGAAFFNCCLNFGADGIDHACKAEES